jgi:hypothetical protein
VSKEGDSGCRASPDPILPMCRSMWSSGPGTSVHIESWRKRNARTHGARTPLAIFRRANEIARAGQGIRIEPPTPDGCTQAQAVRTAQMLGHDMDDEMVTAACGYR